jgi:hypothetical protein
MTLLVRLAVQLALVDAPHGRVVGNPCSKPTSERQDRPRKASVDTQYRAPVPLSIVEGRRSKALHTVVARQLPHRRTAGGSRVAA